MWRRTLRIRSRRTGDKAKGKDFSVMTGIFSVFGGFFVDWGGCVTKPDAENEVKPGVRQGTSLGKGTKAVSR